MARALTFLYKLSLHAEVSEFHCEYGQFCEAFEHSPVSRMQEMLYHTDSFNKFDNKWKSLMVRKDDVSNLELNIDA